MGHYAKVPSIIDGKGIVEQVITARQDFIQSGIVGDSFQWIKTSYNTRGGIHYEPDVVPLVPSLDQSKSLRANYASIGDTYDAVNDVFYESRPSNHYGPFHSWTVSAPAWKWTPPVPYPNDGQFYEWDDPKQQWVLVTSSP
jgi:hypothetical protein